MNQYRKIKKKKTNAKEFSYFLLVIHNIMTFFLAILG